MRFAALPFESEVVLPEIWWNASTSMPAQIYSWTCSACSLDWVKRATGMVSGADIYGGREQTVYEIGYPENINSQYGLMDGSGKQLERVLNETYAQDTKQGWIGFDQVYALAQETTGLMSGANWYHWVALRGTQGSNLWIANSAPGYKGIWDTLSREDFNRLGGFSVVWLV